MYHKNAMYKIFVVGYGEMFANVILGVKDFGGEIFGVLLDEQIKHNSFWLNIKRIFTPSKDFLFIKNLKIKEFKYKSINSSGLKKELLKYQPDFIFVASWSEKLKKEIIDLPKIATINVHPSLLPKYRGANPYHRVILNQEKKTGVTFHLVNEKWDSGEILLQKEVEILETDNGKTLKNKCCNTARKATFELLKSLSEEIIIPIKQNENEATYYPSINAKDVLIDFEKDVDKIDAQLRALYPWASGFFKIKNFYFKITSYKIKDFTHNEKAGKVLKKGFKSLTLALKNNKIIEFEKLKGITFLETFFLPLYIKFFVRK